MQEVLARRTTTTAKKGPTFYKEVLDQIAHEKRDKYTGFRGHMPFLNALLELCQAVEAKDAKRIREATATITKDFPLGGHAPLSETLFQELLIRTHMLGLDGEVAKLRPYLRANIDVPLSGAHGVEGRLWDETVKRVLKQTERPTKKTAKDNLHLLLRTLRTAFREVAAIDVDLRRRDPEHQQYLEKVMALVGKLHAAIQRSYQVLLEEAIADLESGKGYEKLEGVRRLLEDRMKPVLLDVVKMPSGKGQVELSPRDYEVDVTRSTFQGAGGRHIDTLTDDPVAAKKRSIGFTFYDPSTRAAPEKEMFIGRVFEIRREQLKFLQELYGDSENAAIRKQLGGMKLHSDDDWKKFILAKFKKNKERVNDDGEALSQVVDLLQRYLSAFTIHTPFNIEDFGDNYLKRSFPRALTGQLLHDCGVYALRIAYALSLVRRELGLRFRFIQLPVHIGLVITGDRMPVFIAHNNQIIKLDGNQLAANRLAWDHTDPKQQGGMAAFDQDQFVGQLAASFFVPHVDMPFRMVDAPKIGKDTKEGYWRQYQAVQQDVLNPGTGSLEKFHLRYLELTQNHKTLYNDEVVPFWNTKAKELWRQHRDGKLDGGAYRAALMKAYKPIDEGMKAWRQKAGDTSKTLGPSTLSSSGRAPRSRMPGARSSASSGSNSSSATSRNSPKRRTRSESSRRSPSACCPAAIKWSPPALERAPGLEERLEVRQDVGPAPARALDLAADLLGGERSVLDVVRHRELADAAVAGRDVVGQTRRPLGLDLVGPQRAPHHDKPARRVGLDDLAVDDLLGHAHLLVLGRRFVEIRAARAQVVRRQPSVAVLLRPLRAGEGLPDPLGRRLDEDAIDLRRRLGHGRHDSFSSSCLRSVSALTRRSVYLSIQRSWMRRIGTGLRK